MFRTLISRSHRDVVQAVALEFRPGRTSLRLQWTVREGHLTSRWCLTSAHDSKDGETIRNCSAA